MSRYICHCDTSLTTSQNRTQVTLTNKIFQLITKKFLFRPGKKIYIQNHDVFPPNCNLLEQQKANLLSNKTSLASIKPDTDILPSEVVSICLYTNI